MAGTGQSDNKHRECIHPWDDSRALFKIRANVLTALMKL